MSTDRKTRYQRIADDAEMQALLSTLNAWTLSADGKLTKSYSFKNFNEGLGFVTRVAEVAEILDHHPDIFLSWGKVELSIFTHCKGELTKTDFELAKEVESLVSGFSS